MLSARHNVKEVFKRLFVKDLAFQITIAFFLIQCHIQRTFRASIPVGGIQKMSPRNQAVHYPEVSLDQTMPHFFCMKFIESWTTQMLTFESSIV